MSTNLIESSKIYFFGRPYAELLKCFGLEEEELLGRSVLECPSGPSSFVAEANHAGIRAVGVDPLFYRSGDAIRDLALADFRLMFEKVYDARERFARKTYDSVETAERKRKTGLDRFLADYTIGKALGFYQCGSLPYLDFEDESFDYVLCGHLLFVYDDSLDLDFHLESIREMCRVAKFQVRVHPIVNVANEESGFLSRVVDYVESLGHEACIQDVEHEFFKGSNRTLIIRKGNAGD